MSEIIVDGSNKVGFFQRPITLLTGLLILQLCLYFPTYRSMVDIWMRSETFAHGFFILPISAYLIWKKRQQLAITLSQPDYRVLLLLAGINLLWLVAKTVDVLVIEQFAVVLMLPLLVWLVQGFRYTAVIAFPLLFLLFAVPFGDFLVYPLMEFTAVFTVNAVRFVGIPVFWEGLYFTLPTGSWSVVEACSGFRYILASLTLGALYAYLTYHSFWRRAGFMLVALIVPIIANGLRAFMIVMIGHYSGMELAVGVDHLIYGWLWFGIVMFVMFWIGSFWQQKMPTPKTPQPVISSTPPTTYKRARTVVLCAALLLLMPVLLVQQISSGEPETEKSIQLPQQIANWQQQPKAVKPWQPYYRGASQELFAAYKQQGESVGVYVAYFGNQQQGAELVNSSHRLLADEESSSWKEASRTTRRIQLGDISLGLKEIQLKSAQRSLLVWQWKFFNGTHTDNDFYLKFLEAWGKLTGQPRHGAVVILFVEQDGLSSDSQAEAANKLQRVADDLLPLLEVELR